MLGLRVIVPEPETFVVSVNGPDVFCEKFAVMLRLEFKTMVSGFVVLVTPPVHPVNVAPDDGVAVRVIDVPQAKLVPLGF